MAEADKRWRFAVLASIPPKNIQLVAQISSDKSKPDFQWVYFYIAIFCAPLKAEMFESEELRPWCNDKLDLEDAGSGATRGVDKERIDQIFQASSNI